MCERELTPFVNVPIAWWHPTAIDQFREALAISSRQRPNKVVNNAKYQYLNMYYCFAHLDCQHKFHIIYVAILFTTTLVSQDRRLKCNYFSQACMFFLRCGEMNHISTEDCSMRGHTFHIVTYSKKTFARWFVPNKTNAISSAHTDLYFCTMHLCIILWYSMHWRRRL